MSDLGSDSGRAALEMEAKILEAIMKLLGKMMSGVGKMIHSQIDPDKKYKKTQLEQLQKKIKKEKLLDKIDGKKGFVNYKQLQKVGKPLTPVGVDVPKGEFNRIAEMAKRYNLIITGQKAKSEIEGKTYYQLYCISGQEKRLKEVIDRCNKELQIENLNQQINQYKEKGELTEDEQTKLDELIQTKKNNQKEMCEKMNEAIAEEIANKAMYGERKKMDISEALNRITGRSLDEDIHSIVVDAKDPSKYIVCHGYQDTFEGKDYIKTDYRVFSGEKEVFATHDGRFENRPKGYWETQKNKIMRKGEFSGTFLKFYDRQEYERWAEEVKMQNQQELGNMENEIDTGKGIEYETVIKELKGQIEERGAEYKDGFAYDSETGKPIIVKESMTVEEMINASEVKIISEQIANYEQLKALQTEQNLAKTEMLTFEENDPQYHMAKEKLEKCSQSIAEKQGVSQKLIQSRKEINAVQADMITKNAPNKEKEMGKDKEKFKIDEIKKEMDEKKKENDLKKEKSFEQGERTIGKDSRNASSLEER